jgi:hypothetical protein
MTRQGVAGVQVEIGGEVVVGREDPATADLARQGRAALHGQAVEGEVLGAEGDGAG